MTEDFTENEQKVLRGVCQQPWANDREIAQAQNLKMSTVTAIKNRLKRDGIYKKAYLPALEQPEYPIRSIIS